MLVEDKKQIIKLCLQGSIDIENKNKLFNEFFNSESEFLYDTLDVFLNIAIKTLDITDELKEDDFIWRFLEFTKGVEDIDMAVEELVNLYSSL